MGKQIQAPISTMAYLSDVIGAAIFDLNGLPKEYFTTSDTGSMSWVQTIFQAIGLRSLLTSSLQLENFHHAVIQGIDCCAIIVKQKKHYMALLIKQKNGEVSAEIVSWAQSFELESLRANPRFRTA
jgi:predicted regulator of Ras-like GTPase activity (Roadblock/LC7/MglB family)